MNFASLRSSLLNAGFLCRLFAFFSLLLFSNSLSAQTDTTYIQTSEESGVFESQRFIDRYDYLFRTQQRTNWLFKALLPENGPPAVILNLAAERKISPGFSLSFGYGLGPYSEIVYRDSTFDTRVFLLQRFRLEGRWYYDMKKRMVKGLCENNMSGNYIGFEGNYSSIFDRKKFEDFNRVYESAFLLRYGIQRRFFRHGFFDLSYGLGVRRTWFENPDNQKKKPYWGLAGNTRLTFGVCLASPDKKVERSADYCSVWRCHRDQFHMFKIEMLRALNITDNQLITANLNPSYEQKIKDSPWSVIGEGNLGLRHFTGYYADKNRYWGVWGEFQARYYFTLQNRMARGETGNNLAGVYIGASSRYLYEESFYRDSNGKIYQDLKTKKSGIGGRIGIQQNLFNHGFVDFYLLYAAEFERSVGIFNANPASNSNVLNFDFTMRLRAGLAF